MKLLALAALALAPLHAATVSPLFARGYNVLPAPQVARLGPSDFPFTGAWKIERQSVAASDAAVELLDEELAKLPRVTTAGSGTLHLVIAPNSATVGTAQDRDRDVLAQQAYRIDLVRDRVTIAANAPAGLYYGVVTFIQLMRSHPGTTLPEGRIEDWPDLQLRQIYWDDAHHLDRLDALKRAIRQAAFYKLNGFALKLEGHFQYRSAPALVEPQALSPAEYQELTDYGLRHHVQLIPFLDAPGHIAFILKHPEYAGLRAFPDSNYELCATNPDSFKLLFGMFEDLLAANRGVNYFYLSTDEPYYIGLANNRQCQEAARTKELGSVGKVLAEFVTKTANYLHEKGRKVVFWGEFPLKPGDLTSLPPHIVNGETYGREHDTIYKSHDIRQMIYSSSQGEEKLFPEYFPLPAARRLHPARPAPRRVYDTFQTISFNPARQYADLMGTLNAAWGDAGLHPETFWLGYAGAAAAAWHPGAPDPGETMASFYAVFYGLRVAGMDRVYELMSGQAQFWSDSWESAVSVARKPIWGNSEGPFEKPRPARDLRLPLPPVPSAELAYAGQWSTENARRLELASAFLVENDELLGLLRENLPRAERNAYGIEVFLSIAQLYRQNLEMLDGLGRIDGFLRAAGEASAKNQARQAVGAIDRALREARLIRYGRNKAFADAVETWGKSWLPRVSEASGRRFLHEPDDVKDHLPDRTVDMTYLIYRDLLLPFGDWIEQVRAARNQYATAHALPASNERFDWKDLAPAYPPANQE
jgi:hypothetical protein